MLRQSSFPGFALGALLLASAIGVTAGLGCGQSQQSAAPAAPVAGDFTGVWRVRGRTVDVRSGDTREIHGLVRIAEQDGVFSARPELETQYPSPGGAIDAHVIGTASGGLEPEGLRGTAEIQLVTGTVPGVHTEFAFVPRTVSARIASTWVARIREDGALLVELENAPAEGEEAYRPTRTTLSGKRVDEPGAAESSTP